MSIKHQLIQVVVIIVPLLLSACAVKPQPSQIDNNWQQQQQQINSIQQWAVKGRIGIKTADENNSSNFSWQHTPDKQLLKLYGSFGVTYAKISQTRERATLELSDDEKYESNDIEDLLKNVFGYPFPIEHLEYWIKGQPYPGEESDLEFDELGYVKAIHYQQWTITYKKYRRFDSFDAIFLPGKIKVTDGEVVLIMSLRNWSLNSEL